MYTFFFTFFSTMVYHRILNVVLCAYSRTLFTHSVYTSLHLLAPDSQLILAPSPLPLGKHKSVVCVSDSVSVACMLSSFFAIPWTVALQAPVSMARISQANFLGKKSPQVRILEWIAICFIHRFTTHSLDAMCKLQFMVFLCQIYFISVQFSPPTLCNPMEYSMPGFPVHHQLPEFTQIHVHQVSDAIQPSHPLSSPSPPTFNLFHHQGLFK